MTAADTPPGIILVAHEVLARITQAEMIAALPEAYRSLPREIVHLRAVEAKLSELAGFDWASARRKQADEYQTKLQPMLDAYPGWRLQYFGAAPIPLAMELGSFVNGWQSVDVYQQRHDTRTWSWIREGRSESAKFLELKLPAGKITQTGDVVIRVSMSHQVDGNDTNAVIPQSLGELDIALEVPNEDALSSAADLDALKHEFDRVIDWAHAMRPNAQLHLFAAITVGAAFKLGLAINPTIHSLVHAYQYSKCSSPRYGLAFIIQRSESPLLVLSDQQIARAAEVRAAFGEELQGVHKFATRLSENVREKEANWLRAALPDVATNTLYGSMLTLPRIHETELAVSAVDKDTTVIDDSFRYDGPGRMWQFGDHFLRQLADRITDETDLRQAGRLLLLHEAVHIKAHNLTEATAPQVRRFPKILEELDYQADVWAFINDFAYVSACGLSPPKDPRTFFLKVVSVALETMRAFDAGSDERRIEVRRLSRYLIWYWQQLRIERQSTLRGVLDVLANRPYIEVAGPPVQSLDNRVYFLLDPGKFDEPELALLFHHRFIRIGHGPGSRVRDLLLGFRERDPEKIRSSLKSISDQLSD